MLKKLATVGAISFAALGIALSAAPAQAGTFGDGPGGVLSGNVINVPISVPVNVCGNAIAVLGNAYAGCEGGAAVIYKSEPHYGYFPHCRPHCHPVRPCGDGPVYSD